MEQHEKRTHAIARAWERYEVALTNEAVLAMEGSIRSGSSVLVRRHPEGGQVHLVKHDDHALIAVYASCGIAAGLGERIVTFLPADALTAGNSKKRGWKRKRRRCSR